MKFSELKLGDRFYHNAIEHIRSTDRYSEVNAVNLATGEPDWFGLNTEIISKENVVEFGKLKHGDKFTTLDGIEMIKIEQFVKSFRIPCVDARGNNDSYNESKIVNAITIDGNFKLIHSDEKVVHENNN